MTVKSISWYHHRSCRRGAVEIVGVNPGRIVNRVAPCAAHAAADFTSRSAFGAPRVCDPACQVATSEVPAVPTPHARQLILIPSALCPWRRQLVSPIATRRRTSTSPPESANSRFGQTVARLPRTPNSSLAVPVPQTVGERLRLTRPPLHSRPTTANAAPCHHATFHVSW